VLILANSQLRWFGVVRVCNMATESYVVFSTKNKS